jgi:hypothetical protein
MGKWAWTALLGLIALESLAASAESRRGLQQFPNAEVRANRPVILKIRPPAGFKINAAAPNRILLQEPGSGRIVHVWQSGTIRTLELSIGKRAASADPWMLQGTLFICEKTDARICVTQKVRQQFLVTTSARDSTLEWRLAEPSVAREATSPGAPSVR